GGGHHFLSTRQRTLRTRQHHPVVEQELWRLGIDLWRSDHCDRHSGSSSSSLDDNQHPWRELSVEGSTPSWASATIRTGGSIGRATGCVIGLRFAQNAPPIGAAGLRSGRRHSRQNQKKPVRRRSNERPAAVYKRTWPGKSRQKHSKE